MVQIPGATIDISDLHPSEVDWTHGRIRRKRSKTDHHGKVPEVEYLLWPETFELLKGHRSGDPDRVLVTKSGKPYVDRETRNNDHIRLAFAKLSPKLPFKHLRKTSASLLGSNAEHGRFAQYFLGHSPGNVADRYYVKPNQISFDKAVTWLHCRYLQP